MSHKQKDTMPILKHLEELRSCLLRSLLALILGFAVCYAYSREIYSYLLIPFNKAYIEVLNKNPNLIFTSIMEPFIAYLKIALVAGIFAASPYIFYELWRFIAPGLYKNEKRLLVPFVVLAVIFFLGGAAFAYFAVFPIGFKFFIGYSSEFIQPAIKVSDYLKVSLGLLVVFGLVFEFPLVVLFMVYAGILSPKSLSSNWQYIIVGIAFASAIFTPADPLSMILMMFSLLFLYGITLISTVVISKFKKKGAAVS